MVRSTSPRFQQGQIIAGYHTFYLPSIGQEQLFPFPYLPLHWSEALLHASSRARSSPDTTHSISRPLARNNYPLSLIYQSIGQEHFSTLPAGPDHRRIPRLLFIVH
ncbi:hypothetical protein, partial [[Flexibacter] sp. ATCC 35208]|uniref:hypothetical protein n=1 Tax=[Flexibacter] sp. ATCC 35208 TaxID=1936242 RepID=UPI001C6FC6E6